MLPSRIGCLVCTAVAFIVNFIAIFSGLNMVIPISIVVVLAGLFVGAYLANFVAVIVLAVVHSIAGLVYGSLAIYLFIPASKDQLCQTTVNIYGNGTVSIDPKTTGISVSTTNGTTQIIQENCSSVTVNLFGIASTILFFFMVASATFTIFYAVHLYHEKKDKADKMPPPPPKEMEAL